MASNFTVSEEKVETSMQPSDVKAQFGDVEEIVNTFCIMKSLLYNPGSPISDLASNIYLNLDIALFDNITKPSSIKENILELAGYYQHTLNKFFISTRHDTKTLCSLALAADLFDSASCDQNLIEILLNETVPFLQSARCALSQINFVLYGIKQSEEYLEDSFNLAKSSVSSRLSTLNRAIPSQKKTYVKTICESSLCSMGFKVREHQRIVRASGLKPMLESNQALGLSLYIANSHTRVCSLLLLPSFEEQSARNFNGLTIGRITGVKRYQVCDKELDFDYVRYIFFNSSLFKLAHYYCEDSEKHFNEHGYLIRSNTPVFYKYQYNGFSDASYARALDYSSYMVKLKIIYSAKSPESSDLKNFCFNEITVAAIGINLKGQKVKAYLTIERLYKELQCGFLSPMSLYAFDVKTKEFIFRGNLYSNKSSLAICTICQHYGLKSYIVENVCAPCILKSIENIAPRHKAYLQVQNGSMFPPYLNADQIISLYQSRDSDPRHYRDPMLACAGVSLLDAFGTRVGSIFS